MKDDRIGIELPKPEIEGASKGGRDPQQETVGKTILRGRVNQLIPAREKTGLVGAAEVKLQKLNGKSSVEAKRVTIDPP